MPTVRRRVLAIAMMQLLVGAGWLVLISRMQNPSNATYVGVYGLLAVASVSLVTQYNNMGIAVVLAGNWLLALFWLKGFLQHLPSLSALHELSYPAAIVVIANGSPIVLCTINALLIPRLAKPRTGDPPTSGQ